MFGFLGSQKTLKISEPIITKNQEAEEESRTILSAQSTAPNTPVTEPKVITNQPKRIRRWSLKHGLPAPLEMFEIIDMVFMEEGNKDARVLVRASLKEKVFALKDRLGQPLLYGVEHPTFCPIGFCPSGRPFEMMLYDPNGMKVMSLQRKTSCLAGCLIPCLTQQLNAYCPLHAYLGCVEEDLTFCIPKFTIFNNFNVGVFTLRGPIGASLCNNGIEFLMYKRGEYSDVGCITDNWVEEMGDVYSRTLYGIKFPVDISVKVKLLLISAAVLIKYVYYGRKVAKIVDTPLEVEDISLKPRLPVFDLEEVPNEYKRAGDAYNIAMQPTFKNELIPEGREEDEEPEFIRLPPDDSEISVEDKEESDASLRELSDVTYEDMVVDSRTSLSIKDVPNLEEDK